MKTNSTVDASVVLHKTNPEAFDRLYRLIKSSAVAEFCAVDNSPKPCIDSRRYPDLVYIHRPDNPGYGSGHNLAIKRSLGRADYHLVMNPDLSFEPGIIDELRRRMDDSPEAGLIMPMIRYPDGRPQYLCRLLPDPAEMITRRFLPSAFQHLAREYLGTKELRFTGYKREMEVPFLSGCFMFLRTACLEEVGLFDERYFMYAEDLDLSRRIHGRYMTIFYPAATVVHDHSRGSYRNFRMALHHVDSIVRYFNKWGWFFDSERRSVNRRTLRRLVGHYKS